MPAELQGRDALVMRTPSFVSAHFTAVFWRTLAVVLALWAWGPTTANARKNGIAVDGCTGCHGTGQSVSVQANLSPSVFAPGDQVTVDVVVSADSMQAAGIFIQVEEDTGSLSTLSGEGLVAVPGGLTHVAPKPAAGGVTHFRFSWRAPNEVGAARLRMYGIAANGDGKRTGDAGGEGTLDAVYGCEAQPFYYDGDGDGVGRDELPTMRCAGDPPPYYSALSTDCDDFREESFPGATELCNGRDDDCDGDVDEGAIPIALFPDKDGDGYYKEGAGPSIMGCIPKAGYAGEWGDCDETNLSIHRGAQEVCNNLDDDCDGRADDGVHPQCGVGWCRRESPTCAVEDCVEGPPAPETCNGLDDDCDDDVDEGADCGRGASCIDGTCQSAADLAGASDSSDRPPAVGGEPGAPVVQPAKPTASTKTCSVSTMTDRGVHPWPAYGLAAAALVLSRRRVCKSA